MNVRVVLIQTALSKPQALALTESLRARALSLPLVALDDTPCNNGVLMCIVFFSITWQALAHLINAPSKTGGKKFEGVKVICYDSAGWVRENFQAKADLHNKVCCQREGLTRVPSLCKQTFHIQRLWKL